MNLLTLRQQPTQFLALTSLVPDEFDWLLEAFAPRWESYHRFRTLEGRVRRQPAHQERKNAALPGTDTKLFFLLVYLKSNALQQHQAASFGVSQTKVSRLAHVLLDVLNQTLAHLGLLPVRDGADLAQRLAAHPSQVFTYDGMERATLRAGCPAAQAQQYSGKKKRDGVSNMTLCDDEQYVYYLSSTELGSTHDKRITDEFPLTLPAGSVLRQDLGLLGHTLPGVLVEIPCKKPPKQELSFSKKLFNKMLSSTRVVIEHAHSGIKRLRIVKDPIRLRCPWFRDTVLVVACGLHNLRVRSPRRAYLAHERVSLTNLFE